MEQMKTPVMLSLLVVAAGCTGAEPEGALPPTHGQSGPALTAHDIPELPSPDVDLQEAVTGFGGLAGNYVRVPYLAPIGEILSVSLDVYVKEGGGAEGTFTRVRSDLC